MAQSKPCLRKRTLDRTVFKVKTGKPSVSWTEIVMETLLLGLDRRHQEVHRWRSLPPGKRITPRKPRSSWSNPNRDTRTKRLIGDGQDATARAWPVVTKVTLWGRPFEFERKLQELPPPPSDIQPMPNPLLESTRKGRYALPMAVGRELERRRCSRRAQSPEEGPLRE